MQTRPTPTRRPPTTIPTSRNAHDAELVDDLDALLDEIDDCLEHNALEVVRKFRQKGGE